MSSNDLHITTESLTYRGETRTGNEFDGLIIACADGEGKFYRILFDKDGEFVTNHPKVKDLSKFFEMRFTPAKIDSVNCLINTQ